jgi:hypothetical protein
MFHFLSLSAQNVIFENPPNIQASSFLTAWPNFPLFTNSTTLRLGYNYPLRSSRFEAFGGGLRNSFSTTGMGGWYMKWQEQNFRELQIPNSYIFGTSGHTFTPGIRYLANRHNWLGYAASFGLKERSTNLVYVAGSGNELGYTKFVDNNDGKDGVISLQYPIGLGEELRPNLIFETVALDTALNVGGNEDIVTTLATLTNSGNLGFRTTDPKARIDIYGTTGIPNPGSSKPLQALAVRYPGSNNTYTPNFTLTTSSDGSLMGFGTDDPQAKIDIWGNDGIPNSGNKAFAIHNKDNSSVWHENFTILNNASTASVGINNSTPANNLDVVGSSLFSGVSIIKDITNPGSNTEFFSLQDANNQSIFKAKGFKLYMEQFKANTASGTPLLVNQNTGEIYVDPTINEPSQLTHWSLGANNVPYSDVKFGTLSSTDIQLWAGYQQFGIIYGNSTSKKGIVELNTSVGIGGDLTGDFPITNATTTLYLLSKDNTRKWTSGPTPPSNIINSESLATNPNTSSKYKTLQVLNTGHTYFGDFDGSTSPTSFVSIGRANLDAAATPTTGIPTYGLSAIDNTGSYLWRFFYDAPRFRLGDFCDFDATSHTMTWDGDILPNTTVQYNLGSTNKRWNQCWIANGPAITSDRRMKEDIRYFSEGLSMLMKLKPMTYLWKNKSIDKDKHYGFVAQELQEVFPDAIVKGNSEKDTLGVIYTELIPVLTKAIQEQQVLIEKQNAQIEKLNTAIFAQNANGVSNKNVESNGILNKLPVLFQNVPNPFGSNTNIDYFVPNGTIQAGITVYDINGKLIYSFTIDKTGFGRVELNDSEIAQGNYFYTLIVDGKVIDTKTMQAIKK